jgi:hypothetical protein
MSPSGPATIARLHRALAQISVTPARLIASPPMAQGGGPARRASVAISEYSKRCPSSSDDRARVGISRRDRYISRVSLYRCCAVDWLYVSILTIALHPQSSDCDQTIPRPRPLLVPLTPLPSLLLPPSRSILTRRHPLLLLHRRIDLRFRQLKTHRRVKATQGKEFKRYSINWMSSSRSRGSTTRLPRSKFCTSRERRGRASEYIPFELSFRVVAKRLTWPSYLHFDLIANGAVM